MSTPENGIQIRFPTITLGVDRVDATKRLLGLATLMSAVLYIFIPLSQAKFGFWGEHELMDLIGPTGNMPWQKLLSLTSLLHFIQKAGHYAPVHQILVYFECFFLGSKPEVWHAVRLIEALACASFLYYGFLRFLSPLTSVICTLYLFVGEQAEIWMFLASPEVHGFIFTVIGAGILMREYPHTKLKPFRIYIALFSFLLAGASAEAYSLILPSCLFILLAADFIYFPNEKKMTQLWSWSRSSVLVLIGIGFLQLAFVFYSQRSSPLPRSYAQLFEGGPGTETFWIARAASLIPLLFLFLQAIISPRFRPGLAKLSLFALVMLFCGFIPQWIYYGDFVYTLEFLLTPALLFALVLWVLVFQFFNSRAIPRDGLFALKTLFAFVIFAEVCWGVELHRRFIIKSQETVAVYELTHRAVSLASQNPALDYLICVDYHQIEQVKEISNSLSFRSKRLVLPYLKVNMKNIDKAYPFLQLLGRQLETESIQGTTYLSPKSAGIQNPGCCATLILSSDPRFCQEYTHKITLSSNLPSPG